jgi:hypothetical protein
VLPPSGFARYDGPRSGPTRGRVVMDRARIPEVGDLMFLAAPVGNIAGR